MVYVETQESWEIIIKHAEGNNYLICTDILWDPERFRKYRLVTRASLTKVGTLVKLRTNYGDRLFGPFLQSNFQSHERQHDLLPMCMVSLVSISFLSSQKNHCCGGWRLAVGAAGRVLGWAPTTTGPPVPPSAFVNCAWAAVRARNSAARSCSRWNCWRSWCRICVKYNGNYHYWRLPTLLSLFDN